MLASRSLFFLTATSLLAGRHLDGQDGQDPKPSKDDRGAQLLKVALHNLRRAPAISLTTVQENAQAVAFGGNVQKTRCQATYAGTDLVSAAIDDDVRLVGYHGRTAIRGDDGEWVLRRDRLAQGESMPFVPDLHALLTLLESSIDAAKLGQPATVADVQVQQVELVLEGETAREALWSGALPEHEGGFGGGLVMIAGVAGGRLRPATPDTTYRLTFAIDPGTRRLLQIDVAILRKDDGQVRWQVAGVPQAGIAVVEKKDKADDEKKPKEAEAGDAEKKAGQDKAEKEKGENAGRVARAIAGPGGQAQIFVGGAGGNPNPVPGKYTIAFSELETLPDAPEPRVKKLLGMPDATDR